MGSDAGRVAAAPACAQPRPAPGWRHAVLLLMIALPVVALLALRPFGQDPTYHGLADRRALFGIPNFFDVVSNLPFLLVGALGLAHCFGRGRVGAWRSWSVFFAGVGLVAFGSAWYHWAPDDAALFWDRLPMTVGFMGLFAALLAEHVAPRIERWLLPLVLLLGIASVLYWRAFDDLRPYVCVQLVPLLAVAVVPWLFGGRYPRRLWLAAFACYAAAKIAELYDAELFALTGRQFSGHSLKHLLAALACFAIYAMLRARCPRPRRV